MNFYYGSGKIDWREFRERINHETDNDCLRNAILAWMIGIVYLVIGVFYWKQWMAQCDLKEQAIWILPVLGGAPIFLGICSAFSRRLGDWPHCPACGKRLHELCPTIATKRCPHCNAAILADARGIAPGYELPLTPVEISAKKQGTAAEATPQTMPAKVVEQQQEESYSLKLLNTVKRARSKLQLKQDTSAELKAIISTKKNIETMRLKAAADFAGQQATLTFRNADSATLAVFESQRKKMNQRFNKLIRLIDQIDRSQKTVLLPEKLDALILFLDPDTTTSDSSSVPAKQPEKLSRGAAPVKLKKATQ